MKTARPAIAVALGLAALAMFYGPSLISRDPPEVAGLYYSLSTEVAHALGATLLILFLWTSGTLFAERKRLSVALLLVFLIPVSAAMAIGVFDNYRAAHAPRDSDHPLIDDRFEDLSSDAVSRDRAVEIARAAAREGGVDIDNYVLAEKGPVTDQQGREWLVGFVRTNVSWRPGSDLLVAVDRSTGEAKLMPGQ